MRGVNAGAVRERLAQTGIGYAGIDGAWWLPAAVPFRAPTSAQVELDAIAAATFALFDAVSALYGTCEGAGIGLDALIEHRVPTHVPRAISRAPVLSVRPDFQFGPHFVATELEICPSAQGYAHAMQVAYGLTPDLLNAFIDLLGGRELLFVSTGEWSEFVWEQLAFCRALESRGARGRVWLDVSIAQLAEDVRSGRRWQPPIFGVPAKPESWDDDVLGRLRARDFGRYVLEALPERGEELIIFRFGYLDGFAPRVLARLGQLDRTGAAFINPTHFAFDSKAVMAALQLPGLRDRLSSAHLAVLDRAIPETRILVDALLPQLEREREQWVLKFAGFDRGQQAWGGRSLQVGAHCAPDEWAAVLRRYRDLPFPVVAQRAAATAEVAIDYIADDGGVRRLRGRTRVRSFFVRVGPQTMAAGTHLTVSDGSGGVSEGIAAVQAPMVTGD